MYMIEITEDKYSCLTEDIEKGLRYIGKAMQCLDEIKHERSGERRGYRDSEDEEREGFRRGAMGNRYSRY